jgi:secreted trypsin-like serine protease
MRTLLAAHLALGTLFAASAFAGPGEAPVIGGTNAPQGKWPDVAAVFFNSQGMDQQECTGTLIAKNVVITAGHCNDPALDNVLLGTNSLARPQAGEIVPVMKRFEYPLSQTSEDVTVLLLGRDAIEEPRKIATGWAQIDIKNGAAVQFVGYGATDAAGNVYINDLQEVMSTITDFDCTTSVGCNAASKPEGELGAGGGGIDTCPGDSGGPMYLLTSYGNFLAGVTSRSYDNATTACGEGGIYERPDKIIAWAEEQTGVTMARGPEPTSAPLTGVATAPVEVKLEANDPLSASHTFELTTPPTSGTAAVRADGEIRVCLGTATTDSLTVTITDTTDSTRKLAWTLPISATSGEAPTHCDPSAFEGSGSSDGGCCDAGRNAGGSLPLGLGVLVMLRRRRPARSRRS